MTAPATRAAATVRRAARRGGEPVTLRTRAPGEYNRFGEWQPGPATDTALTALREPLDGDERRNLPEGLRNRNVARWTLPGAVPGVVGSETDGDGTVIAGADAAVIIAGAEIWQVVEARRWAGYTVATAVQKSPPDPDDC